ncbi:MAG: DUF1571 domain-containing protein [Chitinophagales bacterium]
MKQYQFLTILLFFSVLFSAYSQSPESIIEEMYDRVMDASGHTFTLTMNEQIDGDMEKSTMECKVDYSSESIYTKMTGGENEGAEILYNPDVYGSKALIKKGIKIKLDPTSSMMRKGMHNLLTDAGFRTPAVLLYESMVMAKKQGILKEAFKLSGSVTFNGKSCYKIEIKDPNFKISNYTVPKSQSLSKLAKTLHLSEYMLAQINGWRVGKSLSSGDVIKVTSAYGKTSVFYIDKSTYLPVYQRITDHKGNLFEEYKFTNIVVDPSFSSKDFSEENPKYDF